jgi:methionine-rich copper-binding protein CopC
MNIRYGGDRIKCKLLLSVLLLFGLALIINVNTSAATTVTSDTINPQVTAVNPANNAIIPTSKPVQVTFSKTITTGNNLISLKNSKGKVIPTKNTISNNKLTIKPTKKLPIGKYHLLLQAGSVQDLSGNKNTAFSSYFTVSPINLVQMKDGIKRAQKFYSTHGRLPYTVSYGSKKITMVQFKQIIATQGLVIKKPKLTVAALSNMSLAAIMRSAAKFHYSSAAHTAAAMIRIGGGDCWAMSDYIYKHMTAAGMKARIIQYATSYSSRHRSVQYFSNGIWVNAPYRTYGVNSMFNATKSSGAVIACNI